jgi:hypothetical protein
MAIAKRQAKSGNRTVDDGLATLTLSFDSPVLAGSTIVAAITCHNGGVTPTGVDDGSGAYTLDKSENGNPNTGHWVQIYSKSNVSAGSPAVVLTLGVATAMTMTIYELTSVATSSPTDGTTSDATGSTTTPSGSITPTQASDAIIACCLGYNTPSDIAVGGSFTRQSLQTVGFIVVCDAYWEDTGAVGAKTVAFTISGALSGPYPTMAAVAYKLAAGGQTPVAGTATLTGIAGRNDRGLVTATTIRGQT